MPSLPTSAARAFRRFPRTLLVTLVGVALLAVFVPVASSSAATTASPGLGVFRGSGLPEQVAQYETWLGKPVGYVVDFVGRTDLAASEPWGKIDNPSWWCNQWSSRPWQLVLSTAMLPNANFSLAAGARGEYDAHWQSFGTALVARGCASTILRIGWEFNARYYPWIAGGQESTFAAYWRRIVDVLRAVPGQAFTFDWTPLAGVNNANVEAAYPGDAYVDIVGLDAYDTSRFTDPMARWDDQVNRVYGLEWQRKFALAHGKPMSLPEWGLSVRYADGLGGGDNPTYITKMWEWINTHDYLYTSYFEVDAVNAAHRLMTTQFPKSSAEYRRLVGGTSGATTTTVAPTTTTTVAPTTTTTVAPTVVTGEAIWAAGARPVRISGDTKAVEVGVKFRTDVKGYISGVRFFKAETNQGTHVASLWKKDGTLLARATFAAETASGWQEVRFATPVRVWAGTTYIASYHMDGGGYAEDVNYFTQSVTRGHLTALRSGFDGDNGVYSYGPTPRFPSRTGTQGRNYWVDVVFSAS